MDKPTLGQVARDSYCLSSRAYGGKWADVSIAVVAAHEERSGTAELVAACEKALNGAMSCISTWTDDCGCDACMAGRTCALDCGAALALIAAWKEAQRG